MNEPPIRCVKERLVYSEEANRWVRLYFDEVMSPDGPARYNRIVEGPADSGPGVVVLPVIQTDKLAFIRVYRYPVGRWLLELPRGFGEVGADALSSAQRELREETSLLADRFEVIGNLYPNSGLLSTRVAVVKATIVEACEARPSSSEGISRVLYLGKSQIEDHISSGDVADGITLGALLMYWCKSN